MLSHTFAKSPPQLILPPTNERPRTSGVFRSIFFRLCAYAGLRFRCTTPPESSIRQCHRHTPLLQRFGEHTPLLTLHYYYTQPKGICQLGSFFFETEVVARYSSLRPEFTTNNEMARCDARHREAYSVLLLLLRCNLQKNTTESLQK